jgi:hypothetical protein
VSPIKRLFSVDEPGTIDLYVIGSKSKYAAASVRYLTSSTARAGAAICTRISVSGVSIVYVRWGWFIKESQNIGE